MKILIKTMKILIKTIKIKFQPIKKSTSALMRKMKEMFSLHFWDQIMPDNEFFAKIFYSNILFTQ